MKKFSVSSLIVQSVLAVAVIAAGTTGCSSTAKLPPQLKLGLEGVEYTPKKPESWQLANGLTVLYLEDTELPLVQGALFVKGGGLWEPQDRTGLIAVLGDQMRQGGAGKLSADALDRELERLAASIGTTFGAEFGKFGFACLRTDLDHVFGLFADVVLRPRFEQERLDLWKGQALESVRRRTDDPGTIAAISFGQLLYGDTVYGRIPVAKDIQAIGRKELQTAHASFLTPRDGVLVITGSVDRRSIKGLIEKHFGDWLPSSEALPPAPALTWTPTPGIYFLTYPFAQATVLLGQLGPKRLPPDYAEIEVFNEVFGAAGFSSRLTRRVRTELGLAYDVFGAVIPAVERGKNLVNLSTKGQSTGQALLETVKILKGLQNAPPSELELAESRRSITNSFVFKFDSSEELVQRAALLQMLDYPANYDDTYVDKINSVSGEDVQSAARKHWDPSKFVVVVVGDENAYNSLQEALKDSPDELPGLKIRKMQFDQKLVM